MATRDVAVFSGANYLSIADTPALDITGDLYVCCWARRDSASGMLVTKSATNQVAWQLGHIAGLLVWTVSGNGTDLTTTTYEPDSMPIGEWCFLEGYHDAANDRIAVVASSESLSEPNAWHTPVTHTTGLKNSSAALQVAAAEGAARLTGQVHSVLILDRVPTLAEREHLFNAGAGRQWWDLDATFREDLVAFWPLDEGAGSSRRDRVAGRLLTEAGTGSVQSGTRTIAPPAEGIHARPMELLRELIASSTAFQEWVGATSEEEAKSFIYLFSDPVEVADRPCAVIYKDSLNLDPPYLGCFVSGSMEFDFEADLDADDESSRIDFANRTGRILEEMTTNAESGGRLYVRQFGQVFPISVSSPTETGSQYIGERLAVDFGVT